MSRLVFVLAVVSLIAVGSSILASDPSAAPIPNESREGSFFIHEDLPDETSQQLGMARQSLLTVDLGAAAQQLRKAAANLRSSSSHADDEIKPRLNTSAGEIESLAHQVENGKVKSADELDQPSARALQRLSLHHYLMARRAWRQKQIEQTGRRLRASAENLEHAARLSEKEVQVGTQTIVRDVRVIAGRLVEGVGYSVDEVGKGFERLGKQVETVGNGMEPSEKTVLRAK